jgi:HSP20 family molecular chaperone IbpA
MSRKIPVVEEPKDFKGHIDDRFNEMERRFADNRSSDYERKTVESKTKSSTFESTTTLGSKTPEKRSETFSQSTEQRTFSTSGGDFDDRVKRSDDFHEWVRKNREKWQREMDERRKNFFNLKSFGESSRPSFSQQSDQRSSFNERIEEFKSRCNFPSSSSTLSSTSFGDRDSFFRDFEKDRPSGFGTISLEFPPSTEINATRDSYELGDDGQMHFKVYFEAKDFRPEDISVTSSDNKVCIKAEYMEKTANREVSKSFSREFTVPTHVSAADISCAYTTDGVLILDAPVKPPAYRDTRLAFSRNGDLGIKAQEPLEHSLKRQNSDEFDQMKCLGREAKVLEIEDTKSNRKKLHLECRVDDTFEPEDFGVFIEGRKIIVNGERKIESDTATKTKTFREEYHASEDLDPLTIRAELHPNGCLIIEAPLKSTP